MAEEQSAESTRFSDGLNEFQKALEVEHEKRLTSATQEGTTQGNQGLPHSDQAEPPPYQMELHALCRQDLVLMQARFGETIQTKYAEIAAAEKKLGRSSTVWENETNELLRTLREEISDKVDTAEEAHDGKKTLLVEILHNQITSPYNQVKNKLNVLRNKLGREGLDTWLDSSVWYFIFLALIGLSEYPLNLIVFADLLLNFYETLLLSGTLIIAIPLTAHFTGVSWKRRAENTHNIWIAIICTAAVIALSWYIGEQRFLYISLIGEDVNVSPESAATSRWILFSLSLLLYGLATLLSYGHHDSNAELQSVEHEHKKAKEKYDEEHPPKQAELNQLIADPKIHLAAISSESLTKRREAHEKARETRSATRRLVWIL